MSVFRVVKNKHYTVMSNYHLRDTRLSLQAKGLLSIMLSLPDDWDYTMAGLVKITGNGITKIRNALNELASYGYLQRGQENNNGKFGKAEYLIYEEPLSENLTSDNTPSEKPISKKQAQINTDATNTEKRIIETINPSSDNEIDGVIETPTQEEIYSTYEQIIRANVDTELFEHELAQLNKRAEQDDLSNEEYDIEFDSINPETMNQVIRYMVSVIAGNSNIPIMIYDTPVPRAVVASKLLKVDHFKLRDCIKTLNTNHKIRNKRNYAISMLYNS